MQSETDHVSARPFRDSLAGPPVVSADAAVAKMRCPSCQKLYSVESRVLKSAAEALRFQCVGCTTRFTARMGGDGEREWVETTEIAPEPAVETPAVARDLRVRVPTERAPLVSEFRCPKCGSRNSLSSAECRFCGVVFAKYKAGDGETDTEIFGKRELSELWDQVMANYDKTELHEKFVRSCFEASCLPYAAQKYARILAVSPHEEIARSMSQRLVGLVSFRTEFAREKGKWQFRVPAFNQVITALGAMMIVLGLMMPGLKSLAGVGFAAVALSIGVRFFLRPSL